MFAAAELLNSDTTGPWFELAGGAWLAVALLTAALFARTAWLRRREGLPRRAWGWAAAAAGSALIGLASIVFLVTILQVGPTLSGADVQLTRPVLHGLPAPPRASLVNETPGPAGTESIIADYRTPDLPQVGAFYQGALAAAGWTPDEAAPNGSLLRYRKGDFVVIVVIDLNGGAAGDYTVTVDRAPAPQPSPSPSQAA